MNRAKSLTGRSTGQLAAALSAATMALGAAVAGLAWAVPAQAARASAVTMASPSLIAVNTLNWSGNAGFGSRAPAWYKDNSGAIHLQGAATQTSASGPRASLLATLPAAARPASSLYFVVDTRNGTYADLAILPSGQIALIDPRPPAEKGFSFVSLEGIIYRPKPSPSVITTIGPDWSPFAGFGSRVPAWFTDKSGLLHLQGAARQTSTTSSTPNLIAILPAAARPAHSLYFVVHTFNGTYADLAILPGGQIAVIDPRPPAVKDYAFVSLESISYQR